MDSKDQGWKSLRHEWPHEDGYYEVKDCQSGAKGKAYYDGWEFRELEMLKGSLFLYPNKVTHWKRWEST